MQAWSSVTDWSKAAECQARGLAVQAWRALGQPESKDLITLCDPDQLQLCANLCFSLGEIALGRRLQWRARRLHPEHEGARLAWAYLLLELRGPVECLDRIRHEPTSSPWQALRIQALAQLHDLKLAEQAFADLDSEYRESADGKRLRARLDWISGEHEQAVSSLANHVAATPYDLKSTRLLHDWFRDLNQRARLLDSLEQAFQRFECQSLAVQAIQCAVEMQDESMLRLWQERVRTLLVWPNHGLDAWLAGESARLYLRLGQTARAREILEHAERLPWFWQKRLERLQAASADAPSYRLQVKPVQQRYFTCAPATLAALLDYFGFPTSEMEVADAICFGGTAPIHQREYLSQRGFVVREFKFTPEAAEALLARGIAFAVSTQNFETGHLQAVTGYDAASGLFQIRDPNRGDDRDSSEELFGFGVFASGPRALVFVPPEQASRIGDLELPEWDGYALVAEIEAALEAAQTERAEAILTKLAERPEWARLHWLAAWDIAHYDNDRYRVLAAIDALLSLYPRDAWLHWCRLSAASGLETHAAREQALQSATLSSAHPNFLISLARFYLQDARQLTYARHLLMRASKKSSISAVLFDARADLLMACEQKTEAARLARFASLQSPRSERYAWKYFEFALGSDEQEAALTLLKERHQQAHTITREPSLTYYRALHRLQRDHAADTLFAELIKAYPDDPELIFEQITRDLGPVAYEQILDRLKPWRQHPTGARLTATALELSGDSEGALKVLHERIEHEPLALDLYERIARLTADCHGLEVMLDFMLSAHRKLPNHLELLELCASYMSRYRPTMAIMVLESALVRHPANAWAWRELGFARLGQGQIGAAKAALAEAKALSPTAPGSFNLEGDIALAEQDVPAALAAWWQAICQGGDCGYAVEQSFRQLDNDACADLLRRQAARLGQDSEDDDKLLPWVSRARNLLPAAECLSLFNALKPRFEHAWQWQIGLIRLLQIEHLDAARAAAESFSEQRPHLPIAWLTRAQIEQHIDLGVALESVDRALSLSPSWVQAITLRADFLIHAGQLDHACKALERACQQIPRDARLLCAFARVAIRLRRFSDAASALERALREDETLDWAWGRLEELSAARAETLALQWTQRRPGSVDAWYRLGVVCSDRNPERAMIATERALQLQPEHVPSINIRAFALTCLGRVRSALALLAAADPDGNEELLVWRRHWILFESRQREAALAGLNAALERFPDSYSLHSLRATHCTERSERALARASLEALRRLDPDDASSALQYAWFLSADGMTDAARDQFRKVLDLAPERMDAWRALITDAIDQNNLTEAFKLFDQARMHSRNSWIEVIALELHVHGGAHAEIDRFMSLALARPDIDESQVEHLRKRLGGRWIEILSRCDRLLVDPVRCGGFSAAYVEARFAKCQSALDRILRRMLQGPVQNSDRQLLRAMLELLARRKDSVGQVLTMHRQFSAIFANDVPLRSKLGYALNKLEQHEDVCKLYQHWRSQPPMPGWAAFNLARSLILCKRMDEALAVRTASVHNDSDFRGVHAGFAWLEATLLGEPVPKTWPELVELDVSNQPNAMLRVYGTDALAMIRACEQPDPWQGMKQLMQRPPSNDLSRRYWSAIRWRQFKRLRGLDRVRYLFLLLPGIRDIAFRATPR